MHDMLIHVSRKLGYPERGGICHGLSLRWLEAFFLDEENIFERRMQKIALEHEKIATSICLLKEKIKAMRKEEKEDRLTNQEEELLDVLAFFDSLELYQSPGDHDSIFHLPYRLEQDDFKPVSLIAGSEKIRALGGLTVIYSEPVCYTIIELKHYLDGLSTILNSVANRTVGILLSSHDHLMSLVYIQDSGWKLMDINQAEPSMISHFFQHNQTELLAKEITEGANVFLKNRYSSLNISVITTAQNQHLGVLQKQLELFKKGHVITKEMARRDEIWIEFIETLKESGNDNLIPRLEENRTDFVHLAASHGHSSVIPILAQHGAPLDRENEKGNTPAYTAALSGHAEVVHALGQYGVDLNTATKTGGSTLVHMAAQNGHLSVLKLLFKLKIKLDARDHRGYTPAHVASYNNRASVIGFFAQKGVDLNALNHEGYAPVHLAVLMGHDAAVDALGQYGADLNAAGFSGVTPAYLTAQRSYGFILKTLIRYDVNLNKPNINGSTPAYIAARKGNVSIIDILGRHQADLNQANVYGTTPLMRAVYSNHVDVIHALASFKVDLMRTDNLCMTPAQTAASFGQASILEALHQYGVDLDEPSDEGDTLVHIAAGLGHRSVILILKKLGANLNTLNHERQTPLELAKQNGHLSVVDVLAQSIAPHVGEKKSLSLRFFTATKASSSESSSLNNSTVFSIK